MWEEERRVGAEVGVSFTLPGTHRGLCSPSQRHCTSSSLRVTGGAKQRIMDLGFKAGAYMFDITWGAFLWCVLSFPKV